MASLSCLRILFVNNAFIWWPVCTQVEGFKMRIKTCVSVWIALLLGAIAAVSGSGTIAQERSIPLAQGPVVLEVSGSTLASAPDQAFAFDIAGLESLGT
ncbi:MAG: hypothetical protein MK107_12635, partial [Oceanicola sp.]|nr:hypothetical protein [Oceanicola sp.]